MDSKTRKLYALFIIMLIWFFSMTLAFPMLFFYTFTYVKDEKGGGLKPFCTPYPWIDQASNITETVGPGQVMSFDVYMVVITLLQYVFPLGLLVFVYAKLCSRIWYNKTPGNAHDDRDETFQNQKKKSIKIMISVVALFGLCW